MLIDTSEERWRRVMAVNVDGVFFGCKRAVQQMRVQEPMCDNRGRIINPAYGVSKVAHLTRQVGVDYAKDKIVCNDRPNRYCDRS
jgi:glucose 1-dehydrogenase